MPTIPLRRYRSIGLLATCAAVLVLSLLWACGDAPASTGDAEEEEVVIVQAPGTKSEADEQARLDARPAGHLAEARIDHAAVMLGDGRVMVTGGKGIVRYPQWITYRHRRDLRPRRARLGTDLSDADGKGEPQVRFALGRTGTGYGRPRTDVVPAFDRVIRPRYGELVRRRRPGIWQVKPRGDGSWGRTRPRNRRQDQGAVRLVRGDIRPRLRRMVNLRARPPGPVPGTAQRCLRMAAS